MKKYSRQGWYLFLFHRGGVLQKTTANADKGSSDSPWSPVKLPPTPGLALPPEAGSPATASSRRHRSRGREPGEAGRGLRSARDSHGSSHTWDRGATSAEGKQLPGLPSPRR